jgi:hypothetical protein
MTTLDDDYAPTAPTKRPAASRNDSETVRTQRCLTWLKAEPKTYAYKVHTGPMGEGGHPDIDGCQCGRAFKIEMKRAGERPNARQMMRLKMWQEAGALVGWAEDVEHVKQILAHRQDYEWRNPLTAPGAPEAARGQA